MTDLDSSITNVFAADLADLWTHRWEVDILVNQLLAGTPGDPRIIEGYLRGKLRGKDEMAKQAFIARTLHTVQAEVSDSLDDLSPDERSEKLLEETAKKGGEIFKRDPNRGGELYEEGRKVGAMLKEAASICWPNARSSRPSVMTKNARQWWPEHVYVLEDRIYLGKKEPDDLLRRVVHTKDMFGNAQSGFAMHEVLNDAALTFTIISDVDMPRDAWGKVFARAMYNGFGAARSMGYGRFQVTRFEKTSGS